MLQEAGCKGSTKRLVSQVGFGDEKIIYYIEVMFDYQRARLGYDYNGITKIIL